MAGRRQIGAIIKLDGEQQFKASITSCKTSISSLKSSLKQIQASYSGNANSLEALSAVQNQYMQIQKKARESIEKTQNAYQKSKEKQDDVKKSMQSMKDAYEAAEKKLKEMKNSGEASADAIEEQSKATEEAYTAYQNYSEAVEKCEARTNRFQKAITDAKTEEINASNAVRQYAEYIEEARQSADGTASSLDEYGKAVKEAGESASDAGGKLGIFSGMLSANLATAGLQKACDLLKAGASYAVDVGSNFEAAMSQVQAISGATGADLEALTAKASQLGRDTIYSATDAGNALYYMSLAGWDTKQMLDSIDGVLNLAAASNMDLANASDIVTDEITAFGLKASDAAHFVDVMAYAQANSNTTTEALGEAYKEVASTAGKFNISVEDTTSVLMTMANAGVKGSTAGNALNTVLTRLMTNTKDCATELKKYGVSIYDSNGQMRSMSSILEGITNAFSGLNQEEQANLAKVIAGQNQYTAFLTILSGLSDEAKKGGQSFGDYTAQLEKCDGTAAKMSATIQDNLNGKMKELSSAAEGFGNAVYNYVRGPLSDLAEGAADVINAVTDELQPATTEIDGFVESVKAAADEVQNTLNNADMSYTNSAADASKIEAYMQVIEEARSKTSLTSYETYQLNNAVKELSSNVPELNDYIDDTSKILQMNSEDFFNLKTTIRQSYRDTMADAVIAKRQAYMLAKADAEVNKKAASDAMDEAAARIDEQKQTIERMEAFYKRTSHTLAEDVEHQAYKRKELETLQALQDAYDDSVDSYGKMSDAQKKTDRALQDFEEHVEEWQGSYGIIIDKNGEWTTASEKLAKATDAQAAAADNAADAADDVQDAVGEAVTAYVQKTEEIKNAGLAETVRNQLAAAGEEVFNFRESIKSNLSSISLFGDRSSMVEAYTSTNRDEMRRNMSWNLYAMKTYTEELDNLKKRGVSNDFVDYLVSQGDAGMNYVHSLSMATDEELKKFQAAFLEYQRYRNGTKENVKALMEDYTQTVLDGIPEGKRMWEKYGAGTMQGFFDKVNEAADAIRSGAITGTINDAMQVVLQQSLNSYTAAVNTQTQNNLPNIAARNTQTQTTAPEPTTRSNVALPNLHTHDTISIDLNIDGEKMANRTVQVIRNRGKITGRR
jgi:TP901 family phage tail tape measure protein